MTSGTSFTALCETQRSHSPTSLLHSMLLWRGMALTAMPSDAGRRGYGYFCEAGCPSYRTMPLRCA